MRKLFLDSATVVLAALRDPEVASRWGQPSTLAEQSIGSIAGHLARGTLWLVTDYLDQPVEPGAPITLPTVADYLAMAMTLTAEDHAGIRTRGAEVAALGPAEVTGRASTALEALRSRLPAEPADRVLPVFGGALMPLDEYLVTRMIEQVVHLDDLARSLDRDPWVLPAEAVDLVLVTGIRHGVARHGAPTMIRALYREQDMPPLF